MNLSKQELGAVLAGLRLLQSMVRDEEVGALRQTPFPPVHSILTNDGELEAICSSGIDALCERLNAPTQAKFVVITDLMDMGANAYVGSFESEEKVREWVGQFYPELNGDEEPDMGDMIGYTVVPLDEFLGDSVMELCLF